MRVTAGAFARVGLLVLLAVILQVSMLAQLFVLGGHADLVPLVVAAAALYGGVLPGAATGFAAGLLLDLALGMSVGASSLVLSVVGYAIGRFRESRDASHGLMPIPVAVAATLGFLIAFGAVNFMLEIGAEVSVLVLRDALVTVVLNALLALPVFALARRVLRPVLVADPALERRRAARPRETGPIGLRGLEV